jgi:heme/copper-type cytochrome/quinol oxidase subunit 2
VGAGGGTGRMRRSRPMLVLTVVALLWLAGASPSLAAGSVPTGAKEALAPVTKMIATLVAIAIGLGVALCGAVIVWGGIEKTLAGANQDAEHRATRRIQNGIQGLVWMILASVIVSTITAIAVAYGLIDPPF